MDGKGTRRFGILAILACLAGSPSLAAMALRSGASTAPSGSQAAETPAAALPAQPPPAEASAPKATAAPEPPRPGQLVAPKKPELCGTVVYAQGGRIVAEVKGGAVARERFRVYEGGIRLRGEVVAVRALADAALLVEPVGLVAVSVGDRLARIPP